MNRVQALRLMKKMHAEGYNYRDIADHLEKIGYIGLRGNPISHHGVAYNIHYGRVRKRRKKVNLRPAKAAKDRVKAEPKSGMVNDLLKTVIGLDINSEEKVSIISQIINAR